MNDYSKLRSLLEKRLQIIADTQLRDTNPDEQLRQLQSVSEDITQWTNEAKSLPQQLNHFLKQSSLSKALEFIENMDKN
ncbi:MAG: hypothetical protein ACSHX6_15285 [Akkermansiaceae bacterium]